MHFKQTPLLSHKVQPVMQTFFVQTLLASKYPVSQIKQVLKALRSQSTQLLTEHAFEQ